MPVTLQQDSRALQLTRASKQYLTTPDNALLRARSAGFTLACFVRFDTTASGQTIVSKWNAGTVDLSQEGLEWELVYNASFTDLVWYVGVVQSDGANLSAGVSSSVPISANTWYSVVCWYDPTAVGSEIGISVNGTADTSNWGPYDGPLYQGTNPVQVGRDDYSGSSLDGRVALLGFWQRVLTSAERTGLYNGGKGCLYAQLPSQIKTSLVAWWDLKEASGIRRESVKQLQDTSYNSVLDFADPTAATYAAGPYDAVSIVAPWVGGSNRAAQFVAAKSQYLTIGDNASLSAGTGVSFTVAGWVWMDTNTGAAECIASKYAATGSTTSEWLLRASGTGLDLKPSFICSSGSTVQTAAWASAVSLGAWHFVVGVFNASTNVASISVDGGAFVNATALPGAVNDSTTAFEIGRRGNATEYLDGRLDHVAYWHRTLSQSEITALYNAGLGLNYSDLTTAQKVSLVSWWGLNEVAGIRYDSHSTNDLSEPSGVPVGWNLGADGRGVLPTVMRGNRGVPLKATGNQYLSVASNTSLQMGSNTSFTLAGWFRVENVPTAYPLIAKYGNAGSREYYLLWNQTSFQFIVSNDGTATTAVSSTAYGTIKPNDWVFVVAWYDGTNLSIQCQNTGTINTAAFSAGANSGSTAFQIGQTVAGATTSGSIGADAVAVWKKALTAAERKALFNNGRGVRYSDLAGITSGSLLTSLSGWWELDEYTGTRADSSGNGNSLSENGGPIFAANAAGQGNLPAPSNGARAVRFDGVAQYLSAADSSVFSVGDTDFTFAGWIRFGQFFNLMTFLSKLGSPNHEYQFATTYSAGAAGMGLQWSISNDGTTLQNASLTGATYPIPLNTWVFVAGQHDATANTIVCSVNLFSGTPAAVTNGGVFDGTAAFNLGRNSGGGQFARCDMQCWGLWKSAAGSGGKLSSALLTTLYNGGIPLRYQDLGASLLTNLSAFWNLDEAGGSRACCVSASNALSENGGSIGWAKALSGGMAPAPVNGDRSALLKSESGQYLSIAHNASLALGDIDFTVGGWVWLDGATGRSSTSVDQVFCAKYNSSTNVRGFLLWKAATNSSWRFQVHPDGTGTNTQADTTFLPREGAWHFVVAWHDSVNNLIGIAVDDGGAVTSAHSTGVFNNTSVPFTLGAHDAAGVFRPISGRLDKWFRYNKVLTAAERTRLFNGGKGLSYAQLSGSLLTSLQAYWALDEPSGQRNDSSGNANHLTDNANVGWAMPVGLSGAPVRARVNGDRAAKITKLDGSQYLSIADNASLPEGNIDFSVAGWVYYDTATNGAGGLTIASKYTSTGNQRSWLLRVLGGTNRVNWIVSNDGTATPNFSHTQALVERTWNFVVATHENGVGLGISINGGAFQTSAATGGCFNSTTQVALGGWGTGSSDNFPCCLDKVALWKKKLSTAEITRLWNNGQGLRYADLASGDSLLTSLQAWWGLNEVSGVRFDEHGNNHLTDNGSVGWAGGMMGGY